jgi:nucleotidyltransferase/DNA polymerase involved in DNA repair
MNTIKQEMQRLNRIANLCNKTEGEMKEMWKQKWHELVKNVARRLDESKVERFTADSRKIH